MDNKKKNSPFPVPDRMGMFGLTVLYQAAIQDVDILFVHGLNGDRIKTWTKDGICWPYDILPHDIPNSRIMSWGYNSEVYKFLRSGPQQSMHQLARELFNDMEMVRHSTLSANRPIIFISHSLGGLIVRQMLIQSKIVLQHTIGLVFLGTPMAESRLTETAKAYTKILGDRGLNANSALLQALRDSSDLKVQAESFRKASGDIPIASFYETRPTGNFGVIVPEASAVLAKAQLSPLNTNHAELSKFSGAHDPSYQSVRRAIQDMLDKFKIGYPRRHFTDSQKVDQPESGIGRAGRSYRTELQKLKSTIEQIKSTLDIGVSGHHQQLQTELGYFREVVGFVIRRKALIAGTDKTMSDVVRVLLDFTHRLEQFSRDLQTFKMDHDNKHEPQDGSDLFGEMASDVGRNLTTVNTILLLSMNRNGNLVWGFLDSLATDTQKGNRDFYFDALTLAVRRGGPLPGDRRSSESDTDSWFGKFKQCQNVLLTRREQGYARVKVAVLDTGLAPELRDRVSDYIDFTDPEMLRDPEDKAGHGTFVTDLLLQVSPNVEVYVARVLGNATTDEDGSDPVNQALRYALDTWEVDIINMSFSWSSYKPANVKKAVELCAKEGILLFAAACNYGSQETPAIGYPASHTGDVFCINSTDRLGNPSPFTPPTRTNADNFSTLGEDLFAAWPSRRHMEGDVEEDDGEEEETVENESEELRIVANSGTSMASPIAAGIAALVIEFCRQYQELFLRGIEEIETYGGMQAVLKFMCSDDSKGGYDWLKPWILFREGMEPEHIAVLISFALLKSVK